jgi:hypothetical protein
MNCAAAVASVACLVLIAACFYFLRQAREAERSLSVARVWLAGMSAECYAPMVRLLADQDFSFLRRQPGATPALLDRLRTQRHRAFQGYLANLHADFARASQLLLFLVVRENPCRPNLPALFIRHRLHFAADLLLLRFRLLLHRFGLARVDATPLVTRLTALRTDLQAL